MFICVMQGTPAYAANTRSTSFTYSLQITGGIGITQDAYVPTGVLMDLGLNGAQDMFVLGMNMYIADTGNKRVLAVDLNTMEYRIIGEGILTEPHGVSADRHGRVYVADSQAVFRFNSGGDLELTFERPTTPNFGINAPFNPIRVAPSDDGGVYIVSEGSTAGIIFMNGRGEFLGYFASNNVKMSIAQRIMRAVLTERQQSRFLRISPVAYAHIFRGEDGLIYTANRGSDVSISRHSISGIDLLADTGSMTLNDVGDIHVTPDGRMFAVEYGSGRIFQFQNEGYILNIFGGGSGNTERVGLFASPSGIGVDDKNRLFVLDEVRNFIQMFEPTVTQLQLFEATKLYEDGRYLESHELLRQMLIFNDTSFLAHLYMGRIYMQLLDYKHALEHFRIANLPFLYSQSFWELRNAWLRTYLGYVMLALLFLFVLWRAVKIADRRVGILGFAGRLKTRCNEFRLYRDLTAITYVIRHPIDNAYNIHAGKTGSYRAGLCIYAALFVIYILSQVGEGFIFSQDPDRFSFFNATLYFIIIPLLFVGVNYYIAQIHDGNGRFKDIFLCVVYGFSPVLLFMPLVILFANVSTVNEAFLIIIFTYVLLIWSAVNIFVALSEIHEYSFTQTVASLLITFFFMLVVVLALSILYMLARQMFDFGQEIVTEVMLRV